MIQKLENKCLALLYMIVEYDIETELLFNRMFDVKRGGIITRSKGRYMGSRVDNIQSPELLSGRALDNDEDTMEFLDVVDKYRTNRFNHTSKRRRKDRI